jgi:hypothetical protein
MQAQGALFYSNKKRCKSSKIGQTNSTKLAHNETNMKKPKKDGN